jgi:hypothetical protein
MPRVEQSALADRPSVRGVALLTSAAAATDGTWFRLDGMSPWTVTVSGSFTGTVRILVANQTTAPADTDNDFPQVEADITTPTALHIEGAYTWVKAQVFTLSAGAVSAHLNVG